MGRVNISVPDEVIDRARAAGLNVSQIATAALLDELDRQGKIDALDAYLAESESELGPISIEEAAAAIEWVDRLLAGSVQRAEHRQLGPPAVAPHEGSV